MNERHVFKRKFEVQACENVLCLLSPPYEKSKLVLFPAKVAVYHPYEAK